jgi:bacterioferritin-associated ferredoxin
MHCGRWILPSQHVRLIGPAKALRQVVLVMNSCGSCPSSADQTLADIRHSPLQIVAEAGDGVSVRPVGNATQLNETQLIEHCDPRRTAAPEAMHNAPVAILSSLARARSMMSSSPLAMGSQ